MTDARGKLRALYLVVLVSFWSFAVATGFTGAAVAADVNVATVTCLSNCGSNAGNVTPDVTITGSGKVAKVTMKVSANTDPGDVGLATGGADATTATKYRLDVKLDGLDPTVGYGSANFQDGTWVESTNTIYGGTTQYDVSLNFQPISMSRDADAPSGAKTDPTHSHWDGSVVASSTNTVAIFSLIEMGGSHASKMEGAYINTDSQAFASPSIDTSSTNPRVTMTTAAPHYESDGTTINQGFTKLHLTTSMVNQLWGGAANTEYITKYTASSQVNNAPTVTNFQYAGTALEWNDYHYSSGDVEGGVDNSVDTVDAGSDQSVSPDETVTFDGTGSSDEAGITKYEWDVDNDNTYEKTGSQPTHSYSNTGDHTVTLKVTDGNDNTATDTMTVSVSTSSSTENDAAPTADAGDDTSTTPHTSVTFDASGSSDDGEITDYQWDFDGDGAYDATGTTTSKSFGSTGTYTVTLKVTDSAGQTDTDTVTVEVSEATTTTEETTTPEETTTTEGATTTTEGTTPSEGTPAAESPTTEPVERTDGEPTEPATPASPTEPTTTAGPPPVTPTTTEPTTTIAAGETTTASGPGFGVAGTVLALLAAALVARRRRP